MVNSVFDLPTGLNGDTFAALTSHEGNCFITKPVCESSLGWDEGGGFLAVLCLKHTTNEKLASTKQKPAQGNTLGI